MQQFETQRRDRRTRLAGALRGRLEEGARDERGAVAIIFALAIVVLVPLVLGLFDLYTATEQRARLQDAIDAAALYAARSDKNTDAEIDALGDKALAANLKLLRGATLISSTFHLEDNNTKVVGVARIQPFAIAPSFFQHYPVNVNTEVVRNSKNLEVALVLDFTGSMAGTKVADLKVAAKELVDMVVKPAAQQTPFYSKVSMVPWAAGVNVNTLADQARGAVVGTKTITAMTSWMTGSQLDVSGATNANPIVITTNNNHGWSTGQAVMLTGVKGMTQINGVAYKIVKTGNKTFSLQTPAGVNVDGTHYGAYQTNGSDKVTACAATDCTMTVTANGHGYANGDYVYMTGVSPSGLGDVLDDSPYLVSGVTTNTFKVFVPAGPTSAYSSGGTSYCTKYGCEYIRFTNQPGTTVKLYQVSKCVSERTGTNQYTDVAPTTTKVGYHYPPATILPGSSVSYASPCPAQPIKPLTTDKDGVKASIEAMTAGGTTAGQVGVAWGWYTLSPNFNYLWSGNAAAAYTAPNTLKVAVIMTDGALNTAYCNGVSSSDSLMFPNDRIDCAATNGSTFTQSLALCSAMRTAGITIYTVGFDISGDATATSFVETCATDADHVYKPETGTALKEAFKAIGADINSLRLAR